MSSNYSIIIDKGEFHKDSFRHISRSLLSGTNSTLNRFIERIKDNWDTWTEVTEGYLIHNSSEKYNDTVEENEWTSKYPKDAKIISLTTLLYKL